MVYRLNTIPRYESAVVVVHANENDFGGEWEFVLSDGDKPFTTTGFIYEPTVTLNIFKADKCVYSGEVEGGIQDGKVVVTIAEQMTASPGRAIAELVISSNQMRKATANFIIDVERSPLSMEGVESDTMINYVESNRARAIAATNAANAAAQAANTAEQAAEQAAEDALEAVANIEAMPNELRSLAALLAAPGSPLKWLGFNSDQDAVALETDRVTPQMYGAVGDGIANDTSAFQSMLEDAGQRGKQVYIPPGTYKLTTMLFTDDSIVTEDYGTYNTKPLVISRVLREDAPPERFISQFNPSDSNSEPTYRIEGGCYDSTNDRIILAFCDEYSDVTQDTDLILTAFNIDNGVDVEPVAVNGDTLTKKIVGGGHGNSLCYNPHTHKIYSIAGNGNIAHQIACIDPDTLEFISWVNPITNGSRPWQMAYDEIHDIYWIESNINSVPCFQAYDASFNLINGTIQIPFAQDEVARASGLFYKTDTLKMNATTCINGQIVQVYMPSRGGTTPYASNATHLVQYSYADGTPKKIYRIPSQHVQDEPQCLVNANGKVYLFTDIGVGNKQYVTVTQLTFNKRVSGGDMSPYTDARQIATSGWLRNMDDMLSVGFYFAGPSVLSQLYNCPCPSYRFNLYVLPFCGKNSRLQLVFAANAAIYIRIFNPNNDGVGTWTDWKQVTTSTVSV